MLCILVWGCGAKRAVMAPQFSAPDTSWTKRVIGAEELQKLAEQDPDLSPASCLEILARLNQKDRSYIQKDIKNKKALKVPNDFRAYLTWTPLPPRILRVVKAQKFILVVKDIPFLGWYEKGKLMGDTHICIGKKNGWTKAGLYRVSEKDVDHVSKSYRSAYGYPALMPYALRIYGHVWIHGGDIVGGYCSHGCINLPLSTAEELFFWAAPGTVVLVVESLKDLDRTLEKHSKLLALS